MVVIQIRGCNATGKTTIVRQFIEKYNLSMKELDVNGTKTIITSNEDNSLVVLGRYDKTIGGCDLYSGTKQVFSTIIYCIKNFNSKTIVFEGMLYSKTFSFTNNLKKAIKNFGYKYIGIYLYRTFDNVVRLLTERNGKGVNLKNLIPTYKSCYTSYLNCKKAGLNMKKINVDNIKFEEMGEILEEYIVE